ncbi:MAG TPA: hypothetical protein VGR95_09720 [Thermoanaerobaculia bacterium]|nr:hypothetical protein [Thermoanaerobaculia bacterium]
MILFAILLVSAGVMQAQWTPGGNSTTADIARTGKVGVMTTGTPSSQFHVFTATSMDGIAVDGSNNPAINFRNSGSIKGYLGLATSANAFFTGSVANDLILRSEGGKIHLGQGSAAPTMTIAGSNVGIGIMAPYYPFHISTTNADTTGGAAQSGGNRNWQAASEEDLLVKPTAAQASGATRIGHVAWAKTDPLNTYSIFDVRGADGYAENYGSGSVNSLTGNLGWAYNANTSAHLANIMGVSAFTETDGGTVDTIINLNTWGAVSVGATATAQYGIFNWASAGGQVGTQYGIYSLVNGNATTRYGLYLDSAAASVTNDYGIYQNANTARNYFAGNVGIGTSPTSSSLTVNGEVYAQSIRFPDQTTLSSGAVASVSANNIASGNFGACCSGGNFSFPAQLGVGTTTPGLALDVKSPGIGWPATGGATQTGILRLSQAAGAGVLDFGIAGTTQLGAWLQATASNSLGSRYDILLNPMGGNVGIGIQGAAKAALSVAGGVGLGQQIGVLGNAGSLGNKPGLFLGTNTSFNGTGATAYFGFTAALQGPSDQPNLYISDFGIVGSSVSDTHRFLRIGYNTADDPSQPFNSKVAIDTYTGDITTSGTITGAKVINAVFQDVAEWVPATEVLPPGTVVVLNPAKGSEVGPSKTAYDTTVAGVVSAHPGIVLGTEAADKAQIATTGRVRVKVDASRNRIRVGDLLVTSDVAGTAMRSVPVDVAGIQMHRPGTIIGKALEPLDAGIGEILVLLSLQ